jgi:5-methylthioadenosine/S-adenosylhomocysteine deaminase
MIRELRIIRICLLLLFLIFTVCTYGKEIGIMDIIVKNSSIVLTINENHDILRKVDIGIKDKKIVYIGKGDNLEAKQYIDASDKIVLPGFVNTHTHIPMSIFKGVADDLPLEIWLNDYIWPLEAKYIDKETVYKASLAGIAEMIHSGITTFNDMYFFEDEVAKAANDASIRAVVSETLMDGETVNSKSPEEGLAYSEWLIRKWQNNDLVKVGVAPHAPYTASDNLLVKAKKLANKYGVIYHIHLAETKNEFDSIKREHSASPVEYLDSLGVLDELTMAAHVVHLDTNDFYILKDRNVKLSHNPESNMKLASGVSPVYGMLKYGINISLGTDGVASNNDLDFFDTMDIAGKLQKVYYMDPVAMSAEELVEAATISGAKALQLDKRIGSIEIGKYADIITIDINNIHAIPIYNPYSQIVYTLSPADVSYVVINGKIVMAKGKILTLNEDEIKETMLEIQNTIIHDLQ